METSDISEIEMLPHSERGSSIEMIDYTAESRINLL